MNSLVPGAGVLGTRVGLGVGLAVAGVAAGDDVGVGVGSRVGLGVGLAVAGVAVAASTGLEVGTGVGLGAGSESQATSSTTMPPASLSAARDANTLVPLRESVNADTVPLMLRPLNVAVSSWIAAGDERFPVDASRWNSTSCRRVRSGRSRRHSLLRLVVCRRRIAGK